MDELIRRLQDRLRYCPAVEMDAHHGRSNDEGQQLPPDPPRPPVTMEVLEEVERTLGFPLPGLARRLYTEVADGGYGPAWGVIPLRSPEGIALRDLEDWEMSVEAWARTYREDPPPEGYPIPPHPSIYFCDAGCGIEYCLDCSTEATRVFIDDPNEYGDGYAYKTAAATLEQWLTEWLDKPWPTELYPTQGPTP
jgi:hypothetical protein